MSLTRRQFLRHSALAAGATLALPLASGCSPAASTVRFGIIADVHHGLAPDADQRLEAFLEASAERSDLDFLIQIGDFCHPTQAAQSFVRQLEAERRPIYHVLGNHDMDLGSKRAILDLWQTENKFYSFDASGFHFVVLDCNYLNIDGKYVDYDTGNFYRNGAARTFVHPDQLDWLRADLAATSKPTIVFSHQGIGTGWAGGPTQNGAAVRAILTEANRHAETPQVLACLSGHNHVDREDIIDGIRYIQINSASYYWVGADYGRMAPYRDPLFAFVTITEDALTIEGRESIFVPPTPTDRGFPRAGEITASIENRVLSHVV